MARVALTDLSIQKLKPADKQVTFWDTTLPAFGIRVSPRSKSFVVMVGRERKLITLGRYPELSLKDARKRAKLAQVEYTGESTTIASKTFPEAVLSFKEAVKSSTKPATYREYFRYLDFFGFSKDVHEITMQDIRTKLKDLDEHPTAQNYAFKTMRAFLNWCLSEQIIDKHPLIRVQLPNRLQSRDRVLTDEEIAKIWHASDYKPFGHIIRVLMLTGQRRMEIGTLTPDQVKDVITFPNTKNNRVHVIPLTPLVKEHLPIERMNSWSKSKEKLDTLCGVSDWVIHDLRRTFSTNAALLGIPIHITERILNHQSGTLSGVARVYNRYSYLKEMEEALLQWEAHIRKITAPEG